MFKKAFILLALCLLASSVFSIRLVEPISQTLSGNDFVGSVEAGINLELILSKEFDRFDSLTMLASLPKDFNVKVLPEPEVIKILIGVPKNAAPGSYDFSFRLSGTKGSEDAQVYLLVKPDLLGASLNNYSASSYVGAPAQFEFSFFNKSYADVTFEIAPDPSLGWYWFSTSNYINDYSSKISVPKQKSDAKGILTVYPRVQGEKKFVVKILFDDTKRSEEFELRLDAKPTMQTKFSESKYGLPFYSFSLLPQYFLNGLVSLFFK